MTRMRSMFLGAMATVAALAGAAALLPQQVQESFLVPLQSVVATATFPLIPEAMLPKARLIVRASIPYWDQARAAASFKAHVERFDMVSFFWYRLSWDGAVVPYQYAHIDRSLVSFAKERGVKALALIANLPEEGDWDSERVARAIGEPEARARHIAQLVALAEEEGFDGISIDYEFLDDAQTEDFSAFINELGAALHAQGKLLTVSLHPQRRGSPKRGQHLPSLQGADVLSIMTYDEHWETSEPGPMGSVPWMRAVVEHALRQGIKPERIFLGVSLDGYDWVENEGGWKADGLLFEETMALVDKLGITPGFDASAVAPHFSYADEEGVDHEVWYEDVRSFKAKIDLARRYRLGGVTLWRQGGEDERIYEVLAEEEEE